MNDIVKGKLVSYDERTGTATFQAKVDFEQLARWEVEEAEIRLIDSRPLSGKQRRSCYAMIREIADWSGDEASEIKEFLKLDFMRGELLEMMDNFSLSNAPMHLVAQFQKWLARFIVRNDVPTRKPMLDYIDDTADYVYACLLHKKCPVCGRAADLHHLDTVGMGRNRATIIHEGMEVMPLCREHHTEIHTTGRAAFLKKYHINCGIIADKTICKLYGLKTKKGDNHE